MRVLGVDVGTQSLKAAVCELGDDGALRIAGEHRVGYGVDRPGDDRAEQQPAVWELALHPAIAGALAAAHATPADLAAIAFTGQLDGCVAVDADGLALHAALIWQDRRAVDEATIVAAADVLAICGQVADPSHLAPKARWLARHGVRAARFHQPVGYLVERVTGEAVIDPALASTSMLFELAADAWSPRLLEAFGITPAQLPRVAAASSIAGRLHARGAELTGLRAGIPVAVGTGDDFAMAIGAGVIAPGTVMCAIGTAEVVGTVAPRPVLDQLDEPMVETHAFVAGRYFVENPGWLSGGAVRWAGALLCARDDAELDALAAAAPPGAGGVTFIPALAGAMTPRWRPHARGTLHGLTAAHDRRHVARAVLEGLAFACRDVVDRLAALGLPARDVLLVGGGAQSRVWAQIRADALGRPHRIAIVPHTAALGAALLAMVAAGALPDVHAATRALAPRTTTVAPARDLDAAYDRYRRAVAALAGLSAAPW
jgi:xylulokinase